jgi:hypothetical protein
MTAMIKHNREIVESSLMKGIHPASKKQLATTKKGASPVTTGTTVRIMGMTSPESMNQKAFTPVSQEFISAVGLE